MEKKKTHTGLILIVLIILASVLLVRHFHIKNFYAVQENVLYTSGQPRGMDYDRLFYRYHISTIVNVRCSFEHRERNWYNEEMIWVKNNGVRYIELPIDRRDAANKYFPEQATQQAFLEIMSNKENLPVLLHGYGVDKRVAMLTAVWLRKGQGCSIEEAVEMVKKITRTRTLSKAETEFINSL